MLKGLLTFIFAPAARAPVHDENVHRLRNAEANIIAGVELAAREGRKMSRKLKQPEHLEDRIKEAEEMADVYRKIGREQDHDPDDGLMSGMDRILKKDGDA